MGIFSKGSDWETHPQGLYIGRLLEVKETSDKFGPKVRWFFETNARNADGEPMKVTLKSSFKGLGNDGSWLHRIIQAFGYNPADKYWLEMDSLAGLNFLIEEKTQIGLEVEHFDKEDGTKGDKIAAVMTVDALKDRRDQLRRSLEAMDEGYTAPAPSANGKGHASAPSRPGGGPAPARQPVAAGGPPHPADEPPSFDDPFRDEG